MNYRWRFMTLYRRQESWPSPRKRNAKRQNGCLTGLEIAEKRRKAKGKGENKRYINSNAEFRRITRRNKKAFLSNQCKERDENNRMGKTRELFKKIRDTEGTLHSKMSTIKDRVVQTQQKQKILRRRGKNTQKNYTKKIFMIQITTMVWSLT